MTTALIFAGGTGIRMNTRSKPKQFLEMHGKPIIIYTLEHFEGHNDVDNIVVVCLREWIAELEKLIRKYEITKVVKIVPGGDTGHDSIYNGLCAMKELCNDDDIVLIHDGVRPLITKELISQNIDTVKKYGNAITAEAAKESVIRCKEDGAVFEIPPRNQMYVAKAPQSFYYKDIMKLHQKAFDAGVKSIDSSHLCSLYNVKMHMIKSTSYNIKITEPADYYIFRALYEALENQQIFGI